MRNLEKKEWEKIIGEVYLAEMEGTADSIIWCIHVIERIKYWRGDVRPEADKALATLTVFLKQMIKKSVLIRRQESRGLTGRRESLVLKRAFAEWKKEQFAEAKGEAK